MKRVIAFVLVLVMCLSLCACGEKAEPEDNSKPTEKTASEAFTAEEEEDAKPDAEEVDAKLAAEDFELTEIKDGEINFKVKIRNISDSELGAREMGFNVQVLDENGDILYDQLCGLTSDLEAGQAIWAGIFRTKETKCAAKAKAICFSSSPHAEQLKEKVVFQLADYGMTEANTVVENEAEKTNDDAVTIENVSVSFVDKLPSKVTSNSSYKNSYSSDLEPIDGQVFAEVKFKVTNNIKEDIKIMDIHDNFMVELNYDNGFVFSTDSDVPCVFMTGKGVGFQKKHSSTSSGASFSVSPLSSKEFTVYFLCNSVVSTETDKSLMVRFYCKYPNYETHDFVIR